MRSFLSFTLFHGIPWPGFDLGVERPRFPLGGHPRDAVGTLVGQIMHLTAIVFHVVQFPWPPGAFGHELPLAVAHGTVPFVFPEEGMGASQFLAIEGWRQAHALHGSDRVAVNLFRVSRTPRSTQVAIRSIRWHG